MKAVLIAVLFVCCGLSVANAKSSFRTADFSYYWSLDEINEFILDLGARFPDITEVEEMGITDENRTIHGIRIVNNEILEQRNFSMPILLITGGASARDWISVMAAVNIIHELVEHYHEYQILVDYLEWFIIPTLNPDGYVFSMTDGNRNWVKNRRLNVASNCTGANIERNFDVQWDSELNSSDDPCDDNFRGPNPNSEEATRLIQFFLRQTADVQQAYISIQAGIPDTFNGHIAYPFSHSNEAIPENWERHRAVAIDMSARVNRITGARYRTGSVSNLVGATAGTSTDYATANVGIPMAFTLYTTPSGQFGFDVETWRINPIVDQVFAAIDDLARHLIFSPTN